MKIYSAHKITVKVNQRLFNPSLLDHKDDLKLETLCQIDLKVVRMWRSQMKTYYVGNINIFLIDTILKWN